MVKRVSPIRLAEATIRETFALMRECVVLETNDRLVAEAARISFGGFGEPAPGARPIRLRIFTERWPGELGSAAGSGDRDHLRTDASTARAEPGELIYHMDGDFLMAHGQRDYLVSHAAAGDGVAYISPAMARSAGLLRFAVIEALALHPLHVRGYLNLHAACVTRGGRSLILRGDPEAGKSTLALAFARRGWSVLAENGVFARADGEGVELWGLPWQVRLREEARVYFPEHAHVPATLQATGKLKTEIALESAHPGQATTRAAPGPLVLLERTQGRTAPALELVPPENALDEFEVTWHRPDYWTDDHQRIAERLAAMGVYRLQVGGTPDETVDLLEREVAYAAQAMPAAD